MLTREKLSEFTAWRQQHITGDEKGLVQIFLDRIFQSLSQRDSLDIAKFRMRKANEDRGGAAFADYVRTPVMLVEKTFDGAGVSGEQERHNSAPFKEFRA